MPNLNVEITDETIRKAKAKCAILGIKLNDYISGLINENTKKINIEKVKK